MTTDIGLPRINSSELRIRAMAHYQDVIAESADRERRTATERGRFRRERAASALAGVLHLDDLPVVMPDVEDESEDPDFVALIDDVQLRVTVDDLASLPSVYVTVDCDPDHVHDWRVTSPAGLGELLTDPPSHTDWLAYREANRRVTAEPDYPTPEQNLLDAIRLFIRNEIEGV